MSITTTQQQLTEKSQAMMNEVELAYAKLQLLSRELQGAKPGSPEARFLQIVTMQLEAAEEALGLNRNEGCMAA